MIPGTMAELHAMVAVLTVYMMAIIILAAVVVAVAWHDQQRHQ